VPATSPWISVVTGLAVLSPHIFTIKSTFAFFLLLGVNLALAPRTAPMRGQALVPRAATPGALSA